MNVIEVVLYGVAALVALSVVLLWKIYCEVVGRKHLQRGDIVLYANPEAKSGEMNNMVTEVLHVFSSHGTAQIRCRGNSLNGNTTGVVSRKHLQLLRLAPNSPLELPTEPIPGGVGQGEDGWRCNQAKWQLIPLHWFNYFVPARK